MHVYVSHSIMLKQKMGYFLASIGRISKILFCHTHKTQICRNFRAIFRPRNTRKFQDIQYQILLDRLTGLTVLSTPKFGDMEEHCFNLSTNIQGTSQEPMSWHFVSSFHLSSVMNNTSTKFCLNMVQIFGHAQGYPTPKSVTPVLECLTYAYFIQGMR